jgi:RNA-directed DNA polymerase
VDRAKPFDIPKRKVWEACKRIEANQGAAGVDGQAIEDFEVDLGKSLYKLWNRMSSGSYFSGAGQAGGHAEERWQDAAVGDTDGGRSLVVKRYLEPLVGPLFHRDSYGYRPSKSALDAVGAARQRSGAVTGCLILISRAFSTASTGRC